MRRKHLEICSHHKSFESTFLAFFCACSKGFMKSEFELPTYMTSLMHVRQMLDSNEKKLLVFGMSLNSFLSCRSLPIFTVILYDKVTGSFERVCAGYCAWCVGFCT